MATNAPAVRLDRIVLTEAQLRVLKILLYYQADMRDRLLLTFPQYTKLEVPNG